MNGTISIADEGPDDADAIRELHRTSFMVRELAAGRLVGASGLVRYHTAFDSLE